MSFEQIIGKKRHSLTPVELAEKVADYKQIHLDLGTGDGLFAWRLARQEPDMFVIGVDADRDSLAEGSARAAKKPARGGCANALFICHDALELPGALLKTATDLHINFPWGSLLHATVEPQLSFLQNLTSGNKNSLSIWLNLHVLSNEEMRRNLSLPEFNENYITGTFLPAYAQAGWQIQQQQTFEAGENVPVASSWAGQLTRNSKRPTMHFLFAKSKQA